MEPTLVGHWKLAGDVDDHSGNENHAENQGADLSATGPDGQVGMAAAFDGRTSFLSIGKSASLQLGESDFTVSAIIHTEPSVDDPIGDIVGNFDADERRGFNLNVKRHSAAASSLSNYRNLQFGIDNGTATPEWTDCGRPGNARFVMSMAVHDGSLYAGTYEDGEGETGHVHRYTGDGDWEDCGPLDASNAVMSLATYQGKLYAGTGRLKGEGSALSNSPNRVIGGRVFRLEDGTWVDCGELQGGERDFPEYDHDTVHSLEVFRGELYAIPIYTKGLFRYDGEHGWTDCGSHGRRAFAIGVYRGNLNTVENGSGIYRFESGENWTRWSRLGDLPGATQNYSMAVYRGKLHVGTWPEGTVFRLEENGEWTSTGRLGDELEVMGMSVHNGKLYAGTLPLAQVYRYDGDDNWTCAGQIDTTPDVKYRRAWSTSVYDGKLFFGTLPAGRVVSLETGRSATDDYELASGWKHIAAIRNGNALELYVDGQQVARSSSFDPSDFDLSNDQPITIGFGAHDYFHGKICDVRMYRRALKPEEVRELCCTLRSEASGG